MNIRDLFKDMDEVRAYAESLKPTLDADGYEILLHLLGLLENRGISETITLNGEEIKIDKYLVPMIKDLNSKGYVTMACCSGLQEEHPEEKFKPSSGYISLAYDKTLLEKLQASLIDPVIEIKESECYLKPSINITIKSQDDLILKEKWGLVWQALGGILND